jgi:DNA adenine methylase
MQYVGGKNRFANEIIAYMPICETLIEPFVGGGGFTRHAVKSGKFSKFFCSDANEYVIEYFHAIQSGWMPKDSYSQDEYLTMKKAWQNKDFSTYSKPEMSVVGHTMGFLGRFFGIPKVCSQRCRVPHKYPIISATKDATWVGNVNFRLCYYDEVVIPDNRCVIYCDPPYINTRAYMNVPKFDHNKFYDWVRELSKQHYVYISELVMPDDFECIWSRQMTGNGKMSTNRIEKLFVHKDGLRYKKELLF